MGNIVDISYISNMLQWINTNTQKTMLISIGKDNRYNFNVDDENLLSLMSNLKKDYESIESEISRVKMQKDENFICKLGEEDMEYPMDMKGFSRFKKDMEKYYTDMMGKAKYDMEKSYTDMMGKAKCDMEKAMKDAEKNYADKFKAKQDSIDAELKVLQAELSNRDSVDIQGSIAEKAKDLAMLVNKATTILQVDSNELWNKSEIEIKKEVILKTYPTLNLDNESDIAIHAMFKTCELYQNDSKKIIEKQKQLINSSVPTQYDSEEPKLSARMQFMTTAWGGNK